MDKYKYDIDKIVILCELFGNEYTECIIDSGMHRLFFKPCAVINGVQLSTNNEILDMHLPILIMHKQYNCVNPDALDYNKPHLSFVVGNTI